mmetsp:Transcript_125623/g.349854  ORF Transcript_125623/g.349854 Transcript_125623/m.349854 type:complete len:88 (+) Transcript_125623:1414-1677(+)
MDPQPRGSVGTASGLSGGNQGPRASACAVQHLEACTDRGYSLVSRLAAAACAANALDGEIRLTGLLSQVVSQMAESSSRSQPKPSTK